MIDKTTDLGNSCRYKSGSWVCAEKEGEDCRHHAGFTCRYKSGENCTCATAMADAYCLLKQILNQMLQETLFDKYRASILKHPHRWENYLDWVGKIGVIPSKESRNA